MELFITAGLSVLLSMMGAVTPTTSTPPVHHQESNYYQVGNRWYDIDTIAYAVSIREGTPTCGIKYKGNYVYLPSQPAYILCRDKLEQQIKRHGFTEAMQIWKTGQINNDPSTNKYIQDIKLILSRTNYYANS